MAYVVLGESNPYENRCTPPHYAVSMSLTRWSPANVLRLERFPPGNLTTGTRTIPGWLGCRSGIPVTSKVSVPATNLSPLRIRRMLVDCFIFPPSILLLPNRIGGYRGTTGIEPARKPLSLLLSQYWLITLPALFLIRHGRFAWAKNLALPRPANLARKPPVKLSTTYITEPLSIRLLDSAFHRLQIPCYIGDFDQRVV